MCNKKVKIVALALAVVLVISAVAIYLIKQKSVIVDDEVVAPYEDNIDVFAFFDCCIDESVDTLKLRTGPGDNYELIKKVPSDSDVKVLGFSTKVNDWLYVECDESVGWVQNEYIIFNSDHLSQIFKANELCRVKYGNISDADFNLYESATADSNIVITLSAGDIVEVVNTYSYTNNGYIEVYYISEKVDNSEHYIGWINADNLEKIGRLGDENKYDYSIDNVYTLSKDVVACDEQSQYEAVVVDSAEPVSLKKGPGNEYDEIDTIPQMSLIYTVGKLNSSDEWLLVYYLHEDKHGWVNAEKLATVKDAEIVEKVEEGQIIVDKITYTFEGACPIEAEANDDNGTKLMSAPDENSRCILVMEKGAEFTDVGPVEGYSGWTYAEYNDGLTKHVGFVKVGE